MNISGSGSIAAGEYNEKISISGSGRLKGNVRCASFSASGSAVGEGDLVCMEKASVSGSVRCAGGLTAGELHVSGSLNVGGACTVGDKIRVSGSMDCGGALRCGILEASGSVRAELGIEAEEIRISGAVESSGLMNAEKVDFELGNRRSRLGSIGGADIRIYHGTASKSLFRLPLLSKIVGASTPCGLQVAESVEGDVIAIENVTAPLVVGRVVAIGAGCHIDLVQYTEQIEIHESARVEKIEKV